MKSIPFLKILVPFLLGIACVLQHVFISHLHLFFTLSFIVLGISALALEFHKGWHAAKRFIFLSSAVAFLFLLAFEADYFYNAKRGTDHYSHYTEQAEQELIGTVSDMPVATEKSLKLQVELDAIKQHGTWHYASGNIVVYIKQPIVQPLFTGSRFLLRSKLNTIAAPQNPGEFDYKTFLEHKNIFHTAYAEPQALSVIEVNTAINSVTALGIAVKEQVVRTLREAGLSQEAFSICTALLVGYDDEISGDVMQSFSHSGTLHVLSVSGMHTGILYLVLLFLFGLFDKHNRYKKTKCFFVIIALLLFVAITGFSPSVLRAALMLTLMLLGKTFNRSGNPYNILVVSAFSLLLYNPYFIADVGFLLSYLAVFGIIYLFPIMNKRWYVQNRILKFFWELSLMSVAATLFTLPVTLYYFHQFPTWFILSNLVIIPLSTVLMGAAFALLICYKIIFLKQGLVFLINKVTAIMLLTARLTDHPVYGFMDYISFGIMDVVFSVAMILLLLWFLSTKSFRALATGLACFILWITVSMIINYQELKENEFIVFSVKHKSASILRSGHNVYIQADSLSEGEFRRYVKPYLLGYSGLGMIHNTSDVWHFQNKTMITMSKAFTAHAGIDYLVVRNNLPVNFTSAKQNKLLVIADCSNSYTFVKKLKRQCAMLKIAFYSVKESGAFKIQF
jgi:competence protein ComEC